MTKTILAIVAAGALTAGPAVLQGQFANRWGSPPNLSAAGEQLHQLPRQLGHWQNVEDMRPLSEAVCRELGLVEHFHRQYLHAESGDRIDVLLMVGPPGRLVRHPPDVCYSNRANRQVGETQSLEVETDSGTHRFELLSFQRTSELAPSEFCVAYAFATDQGNWLTPDSPRMKFGAEPVLYKLQVLSEGRAEFGSAKIGEFLAEFVDVFSAEVADGANENAEERAKVSEELE